MMEFTTQSDNEILFSNSLRQIFWLFLFTLITVRIVMLDLSSGIEKWNKILMPSFVFLLLGLFIYSFFLEGFSQAISFLFKPNTENFSTTSALEAIGQSFFTLSLGMGCIITYGSYLSRKENLIKTSIIVALLDTFVALVMGIIIFSVVFSFSLEPHSGPSLIFNTLPKLFSKIPGGLILSPLFFLLIFFAALTSSISILEILVTYFTETLNKTRKKVSFFLGIVFFFLGCVTTLSLSEWSHIKLFGFNFFDFLDKTVSNYLLPIGGILTSLFLGWAIGPKALKHIFPSQISPLFKFLFLWFIRIISPASIFFVLYHTSFKS